MQILHNRKLPFAVDLEMVLSVTDVPSGCVVRDTMLLKAPTGSFFPGIVTPAPLCPGGSAKFTGTPINGVTYTWSPATGLNTTTGLNVTASPTTTTEYTITASGCGPASDTTITVTVNTVEDFTLTDKTNCPSAGVAIGLGASGNTASVSNVASYAWSPSTGLSDCYRSKSYRLVPTERPNIP
jgi:hypothetical protein